MPVSILEAWTQWAASTLASNSVLWGVTIQWWGRIGSTLEFLGGLAVIAEIVGATKLQEYGQGLRDAISSKGLKDQLLAAAKLIRDCLVSFFWFGKKAHDAADRVFTSPHRWVYFTLTLLIAALIFENTRGNAAPWYGLAFGVIFCLSIAAIIAPFVVAFLVLIIVVIVALADLLAIKPLAKLVANPKLDKTAKIVGVLLVVVGFHFDLLAA